MVRLVTLFWIFLVAVTGALVFITSENVQISEENLTVLEKNIVREKEALRVLKAEWSYLNRPERLEILARTYLLMKPPQDVQFAQIGIMPEPAIAPVVPVTKPAVPKILVTHTIPEIPAQQKPIEVQNAPKASSREFSNVLDSLDSPG